MTSGATERDRAKADRYSAILHEAAKLFAERGFSGVSLEDLGGAVGVSGPALYRHFANKQALLGAVLVGVSERLLAGGEAVVDADGSARQRLDGLIRFHVDFALADADVIRVQDRDLASLGDDDRHRVRRLQRSYVDLWVAVLGDLLPDHDAMDLRLRAQACFGLINSTPHSVRALRDAPEDAAVRATLEAMAAAALLA
ncbi:TetR/AcrR family transcriptional regulator [Microbacterium awajiense]|uniref:TetR/AcrR family transcriptional regulator n=1 Tax=Microbacterium awajiense TaxID=415214 RepID=A0ABP7A3K4_9MICO